MRAHGRRVQEIPKSAAGVIRRDRRRDSRKQDQPEDEYSGAANHARSSEATRGSVHASRRSATSVPIARNNAPVAAQPATRNRSRAFSASNINRPRPGHDVTTSTTNEPLNSEPIITP